MPCPFDAHATYPRRCCRLLWVVARASQPSGCVSYRSSNGWHQTVKTVRPFTRASPSLLWPRLTSATTSALLTKYLARRHPRRALRVRRVTFLPYTRHIYTASVRMTLGFESLRPLAHPNSASCDLCTSDREFACCFRQIPSRLGHPCSSAKSSCHQGL